LSEEICCGADDVGIRLYGHKTGNCFRAAIALEEAGLAYQVRLVDLRQKQHKQPEFLALNRRGRVPVMVIRSHGCSDFVLAQSNAIMLYAAEVSPGKLLPAPNTKARARALERFLYFVTDVIAPNHAAFTLKSAADTRESAALLRGRSLEALVAAEEFLAESPYIAGDEFTLADISAYTIAMASEPAPEWAALPNMLRWYQRIGERSAVNRGLHAFDGSRSA
jgi:GSH-dependent disulfide-bond oxidoreductase